MSNKFKLGDRVICLAMIDNNEKVVNAIGTIKHFDACGVAGVAFDKNISGHELSNYSAAKGCGWYINSEDLKLLTKQLEFAF